MMEPNVVDGKLLMSNFSNIGEAFQWLGGATTDEIQELMAKLRTQTGAAPPVHDPTPEALCLTKKNEDTPSCPPIKLPHTHPPVLVWDTETSGLKPAIVCQLAYLKFESGELVKTYNELLKLPPGAKIERRAFEVHGISASDCAERGVDAAHALELFAKECSTVLVRGGRIVAHNVAFDVRALRETRLAHNVIDFGDSQELDVRDTFCTMKASKQYSPLKDKANRRKAFTNAELFEFLFGEKPMFAKLHDALGDIQITASNYAAGLARGWW